MGKVEFELDSKGVRKMLQAKFMKTMVTREAEQRKEPEDRLNPFIGFDRAKCLIYGGNDDRD